MGSGASRGSSSKPWGWPHSVGVGRLVRRPGPAAWLQDALAGELLCVEEIYGLRCICGCPEGSV